MISWEKRKRREGYMGFNPGGGGGIGGASDVALNNPANGHLLGYDGSVSKWKNITPDSVVNYDSLPAGSIVVVNKSAGAYPARPTNRADITVRWRGDTLPPDAIEGDEFLLREV